MKFLFVVALVALAIQVTVAQTSTATTTAATATTTAATATTTAATATTTAATATTTTTAASSATTKKSTKRCWRGNNWCNTRQQKKCKHPERCIKTIVVVRRHRG